MVIIKWPNFIKVSYTIRVVLYAKLSVHNCLERYDQLTSKNNRLFITEFDTKEMNIHKRALDLEDFMRLTYSHPEVDGITLWEFMATRNNIIAQNSDQFRHMFENEVLFYLFNFFSSEHFRAPVRAKFA